MYDVVKTQFYISNDTLALNLAESKDFPDRRRIMTFGQLVGIKKGNEIAAQVREELNKLSNYTALMSHDIKAVILKNLHLATTRTAIKFHPRRKNTKYKN